ncbi:hypothetical protein P5V15_010547 [Pogonomyrmex californicus]
MSKVGELEIATSKTHTQPHFANHTQSSLMKRRTPMKKSLSSTKNVNESKRAQGNGILKLNGICKKRNSVTKQSKSMQMLIMTLKQQRDRTIVFLSDSELTETICRTEKSLCSLGSDLIKDISFNIKRCTESPAKLATLCDKSIKIVNESEKHTENSHASLPDSTSCIRRNDSENICNFSENHPLIDNVHKFQVNSSDGEESTHCEVEILYENLEREKPNHSTKEDYSQEIETQIHLQNMLPNVNAVTNRKRTRKCWIKKATARNEHVDEGHVDLQDFKNTKFPRNINNTRNKDKTVVNDDSTTQKRSTFQKNLAFTNQRIWRPPGIPKTLVAESATSLMHPVLQKSSQSFKKSSTASTKSKQSSIESFNSEPTSAILTSQSKVKEKENRDPRANRMTKICEHLVETKQRQWLQSGGPKKRRSKTKVLDKCDDANPILPKSKSRHSQTQPIMLQESSNNRNAIESGRTDSLSICNKSKNREVIYTLKRIINNVKEDKDVNENSVNISENTFYKKNNSEIQTSPNRDILSQNHKLHILTKDMNLNEADRVSGQPSQKTISTQTKLNCDLYLKTDIEKDKDSKILQTRIVATQTSPNYDRNVVEVGCNTESYNVVCNDVEISCNLIDFTNLKAEVDSTVIQSTSDFPIHTTKSLFNKRAEINSESENKFDKNKEIPFNKYDEILSTQMNLKLESYDSTEIPIKSTKATEKLEVTCDNSYPIFLESRNYSNNMTNIDIDEHKESLKYFNKQYVNDNTSINDLESQISNQFFNYESSSEDSTEYNVLVQNLENDMLAEDMPKSKVKNIPSDLLAAFELAAERARNIHEAIIIYRENLISRNFEKQNEEIENNETSETRENRHRFEKYVPFTKHENIDNIKSERKAAYHFVNNDHLDGFFTYSCNSSDQPYKSAFSSLEDIRSEIDHKENNALNNVLKDEETVARSSLNERNEISDREMKLLMQLLIHDTQEKYALELLQPERGGNDESLEMERMINKPLALPAAIKRTSFISCENLFPLYCCIICTVVFWCLQFSFQCDSMK